MNKLIVIAEAEELKLVDKLKFKGIPVLITGVGASNVIEALRDTPKDTHIINIGYAGSKNLQPGKFYGVDKTCIYHPNVDYPEKTYGLLKINIAGFSFESKKCYSGCDFVLNSNYEDCLFDMELCYIAALGFKNLSSFKYVSDNLDLQEYKKEFKKQSIETKH